MVEEAYAEPTTGCLRVSIPTTGSDLTVKEIVSVARLVPADWINALL